MYELIKDRLVPGIDHPLPFKRRSQSMRTKRTQCDCQEAKRGCDSKKQNRHVATSGELARSQLFFQSVNANCPFRRFSLKKKIVPATPSAAAPRKFRAGPSFHRY